MLSCVLIFTSEALCISCFPSPVENGFIECGTAVKKNFRETKPEPVLNRGAVTQNIAKLLSVRFSGGERIPCDQECGGKTTVLYYYISHIDVNCVLTIHLPGCHAYVTGMLMLTTLSAIRWHFEGGGKTVYGRQEMMQSEIRTNWKQLLMIGGAFVHFELHQ